LTARGSLFLNRESSVQFSPEMSSREAASACSPLPALSLSKGRKPRVRGEKEISPEGAEEWLRYESAREEISSLFF
jgi:hypothetical protein